MSEELKRRTVIVTGAASGLGRAVAKRLASDGDLIGVFDFQFEGAQRTARDIEASGGVALAVHVDISDWASVDRAVHELVSRLGPPRGLVNAAAIRGAVEHAHTLDPMEWLRVIGVDLTGTYLMCRAVLPYLLEPDDDRAIVNIASTAGLTGFPYSAAYCAAKGGVVLLTRALAVEYSDRGVRVNGVAPGGMRTPMLDVTFPPDVSEKVLSHVRRALLDIAQPEEVANVVRFLLSSEARYITGSIVVVDGGALA
jgi:NAD(P)-dependent dehydrogenase (short-subunit alcohol dehydrogenase family)